MPACRDSRNAGSCSGVTVRCRVTVTGMDALICCGTCGMVDGRTGAGAGLACPRCGSRAVETVELPSNGSRKRLLEVLWLSDPSPAELGAGGHVPVVRDVAA